jgi:hypothetical protein
MRHGEHAVHGSADLPQGNGDRPPRQRHWRPSGRVWLASQRAAIAAALIGFGYGLASVLNTTPPQALGVALSTDTSAEAGAGVRQSLLEGLSADEDLPGIRPHDDEYWHLTFPRQVVEMINATISGVRCKQACRAQTLGLQRS